MALCNSFNKGHPDYNCVSGQGGFVSKGEAFYYSREYQRYRNIAQKYWYPTYTAGIASPDPQSNLTQI